MKRSTAELYRDAPYWSNAAKGQFEQGVESQGKNQPENALAHFKSAIESLNQIADIELSKDDYSIMARSCFNAGSICLKISQINEAEKFFKASIESLNQNQIGDEETFKKDWRLLASAQCNLGVVYRETKQYEKAKKTSEESIENLKHILEKDLSRDDFFMIGSSQFSIAYVYAETERPEEALEHYELAIVNLQKYLTYGEPEASHDYYTIMAKSQLFVALIHYTKKEQDKEKALRFCEAAIETLKPVLNTAASGEQWRTLARSQKLVGKIYLENNQPEEGIKALEAGIDSFQRIASKDFLIGDWDKLVASQIHVGERYITQKQYRKALEYFEASIRITNQIQCSNFSDQEWGLLSNIQGRLGYVYAKCNDFGKSRSSLLSALDSMLNIKDSVESNLYTTILACFNHLGIRTINTLEKNIYGFVKQIFSVTTPQFLATFEQRLNLYHLAILDKPMSTHSHLYRVWFNVLKFVENKVDRVDFPNTDVKIYLADESNRQMFKEKLQDIKGKYDDLTLVQTIGQSDNFPVNVAIKIKALEEKINLQDKKILVLEEENKQLRLQQQSNKTVSLYKSGQTQFNATPPIVGVVEPLVEDKNQFEF